MALAAAGTELEHRSTVMTTNTRSTPTRMAWALAALGLLAVLAGDRGITAAARGIDPLQVLDLEVKPNVIVVLDSSGSMRETVYKGANYPMISGDNPYSKMFIAKQVLTDLVTQNSNRVNFLFGQYTQQNVTFSNQGVGTDRFYYVTRNVESPSMETTTELAINRQPPPTITVDITPTNNSIVYNERVDTTSTPATRRTFIQCTVTLPTGTYSTDADFTTLATVLTTRMNHTYTGADKVCVKTGTSSNSLLNDYTFTWDAANRRFRYQRTAGTYAYQMRFAVANTAGTAMGFTTNNPNTTTPPPNDSTTFANTNWLTSGTTIYNGNALGASGVASRGFQAWQDIRTGWNTIYFREGSRDCTITVPTGFYSRGDALATAIQNAMNGCTGRTAPVNTYRVTHTASSGRFTFACDPSCNQQVTFQWGSMRSVLNAGTNDATINVGGVSWQTPNDSVRLLRRGSGDEWTETYDPDGSGTAYSSMAVRTYYFTAGRFFNGETVYLLADGSLCGISTTRSPTNPPTITLQQVNGCGGPSVGAAVTLQFAGGRFDGNTVSCNGYDAKVPLGLCQDTSNQLTQISPFLDRELALDDGTTAEIGWIKGYQENTTTGTYAVTSVPTQAGIRANGSTPIGESLRDIKTLFGTTNATGLWGAGQTNPARGPIRSQVYPRERTIVLFVTDGLDTCAVNGNEGRENALVSAYRAEELYRLIDASVDAQGNLLYPESSVTTYMIGFGLTAASQEYLNYIAWGGSGLGQNRLGQPDVATSGTSWDLAQPLSYYQGLRNQCATCVDAYLAPDAETLKNTLQTIINQGASSGEFTAQQSITASLFELVKQVPPVSGMTFDPDNPATRYEAIVPTLFRSTFTLPSFKGQLKAIQNDGAGNPVLKWEAGAKLRALVSNAMSSCNDGGLLGECAFSSLASGRIPRRVYSTSRNGVFGASNGVTITDLMAGTSPQRLSIWPPESVVDPAAGTGVLDAALGLPTDFATLQSQFKACQGAPLNAGCTASSAAEALREARQIVLAYMAGAQPVYDSNGFPKRSSIAGAAYGQILYRTRDWLLADSTMATPAMISVPIDSSPDASGGGPGYDQEWTVYRDGPRDTAGAARDGVNMGFGLRNPDKDSTSGTGGSASNPVLKPVMSVIYVGANDMLHAFRSAPNCSSPGTKTASPTDSPCTETGGEELWGFVPFDQLGKLQRLYLYPPTRKDHDYVIAAPLRFADVFVPSPGTAASSYSTFNTNVTGATATNSLALKGVWRRVLLLGRGQGGKFITALDVTAPGAYTKLSTQAQGPIVLWSRGNPDTQDGTVSGTANHDAADGAAYAKMGETWSVPAVAWVNKLKTARKDCTTTAGTQPTDPGPLVCKDQTRREGVEYVAFVGSGYGAAGEGTTFFTLDVLTGDVIASATVPAAAGAPSGGYENALVASPSTFAAAQFAVTGAPNIAGAKTTRIYIGDLHGRVWKFLAAKPDVPILLKDFGVNQPIATPVTLNVLQKTSGTLTTTYPAVFVATGNDLRAEWNDSDRFKISGVMDIVTSDIDTTPPDPADPALTLFIRDLEQEFRGTVQPAAAFATNGPVVFFGGTRFVPPPPLSPLSTLPTTSDPTCRSRFDSIIYVLKGETGSAAFNLNASGDDAFVTFDNSKIAAISVVADPRPGAKGSSLQVDEGLNKAGAAQGAVPPDQGKRPATVGSNGVAFGAIQPSSTICRR
jgi:hypothetical protein